jgi:hypothetical protein
MATDIGGLVAPERPPGGLVSVASCSREPGHMEVFWTDGSGRVFYRWWLESNGWSEEDQWDSPAATHVAALSRAPGDQLLFGVNGVGRMWWRKWAVDHRGWMVAGPAEYLAGEVTGPITAVSREAWHCEITAWTPSGEPVRIAREDHEWTAWTSAWPPRP